MPISCKEELAILSDIAESLRILAGRKAPRGGPLPVDSILSGYDRIYEENFEARHREDPFLLERIGLGDMPERLK